ncbi:haloacid dehalogenase type II [Ruegeria profundi]|uniref:Haloacid dehalogenase n=1 Tax=Ruegeria profundi TaxID=1685378 RepID=A0A0X3TU39_9RHOB|nr:haloacid dehalogenase type II [Ruegeria profundi]KUJ79238.1 hypothetical protein AVO44_08345 [Ruegeria profundi]
MKDLRTGLAGKAEGSRVGFNRRSFMMMTAAGGASIAAGSILPTSAKAQIDPSQIKACVFDTFGTLLDWRDSVARQMQAFADTKGVEGDWFDFADQWRGYYYRLTAEIGQYKMQYMPVGYIHRIGLEELLPQFGFKDVTEEEKFELNKVWHRLEPWPDTVEGLQRLKSKFIISPLSNSDFRMMVDMSKYAGLPWDVVMTAEDPQAYKPDVRMYLQAPARLKLEPQEVLMCAAHLLDLKAAAVGGLRTAFIARPNEYGAPPNKYYTAETEAGPDVDFASTSVIDLAEQLGA